MVKNEEFMVLDLPLRIESKEQFTLVVIKLLYIKNQFPDLPPEDSIEYEQMMYLYSLFNEYIEKTGEQTVEIPEEFLELFNLPKENLKFASIC